MKVAQERERLLVERLGEEKYIKSLLERLDVTNPDQSKSDISMNRSVLQPNLAPLKNIKAVPDSDQQHVTLVFADGQGGKSRKMQNKIELLPSNASILQNTSKLDVSQGGAIISADEIMNNAHSASPSSFFTPNTQANGNGQVDTSLIDLQGGNML